MEGLLFEAAIFGFDLCCPYSPGTKKIPALSSGGEEEGALELLDG